MGWTRPYYRNTLANQDLLGLDSIQGILEFAERFPKAKFRLVVSEEDREHPYSEYSIIRQLEEEGYARATWTRDPEPNVGDGAPMLLLERLQLTIKGHEHLDSLRQRSKAGRWKKRIRDLAWIVPTSIITTLLTLLLRDLFS